jgi:predicted dehydrogenase
MITRRKFLDGVAVGVAGAAVASTARSYAQILGANERVNFALNGLNSRGYAHLSSLNSNKATARVVYCNDVDAKILQKFHAAAEKEVGYSIKAEGDFRKALDSKDVDAISISTPDHWHTPMAIMALKAGKHVYVEKPSSQNPREGELLIASQKKHGKLVQVGTQSRSSKWTAQIIERIHNGAIGRAYYAKAWYNNTRGSMGTGKVIAVPEWLNWDLWQGPAPRSEYKDNIHPYNWHWLRRYGTGEALNNGTHEVDVARWALQTDAYPQKITSSGGRYAFKDDWQFYDTMVTSHEYADKMISWECMCSNGMTTYGRDRGIVVHGTTGSVVMDRTSGGDFYNLNGKKTDSVMPVKAVVSDSHDLVGRDAYTDAHFANFIAGIRTGEALRAPVEKIQVTVTGMLLSNIAWITNHELKINTETGHILNDPEAMKLWGRTYEKGWEVTP